MGFLQLYASFGAFRVFFIWSRTKIALVIRLRKPSAIRALVCYAGFMTRWKPFWEELKMYNILFYLVEMLGLPVEGPTGDIDIGIEFEWGKPGENKQGPFVNHKPFLYNLPYEGMKRGDPTGMVKRYPRDNWTPPKEYPPPPNGRVR